MSITQFIKSRSLLAWITLALGSLVFFEILIVQPHPSPVGLNSNTFWKPWLFPLMLAFGLILVGITELFTKREYRFRSKTFSPKVSYGTFPVTILIMFIYVATFESLGFMVASSIAMLLLAIVGYRRLRVTPLILAIVLPALLYFLMVHLLGVYLPDGVIA